MYDPNNSHSNNNPQHNQQPPHPQGDQPQGHNPYGYHPQGHYPQGYYPYQPPWPYVMEPPGKNKVIIALACGVFALFIPIPVIDVIAGIVGICLANSAKADGNHTGLRTGAFAISIVGTIAAVIFTLSFLL